MQRVSNSAEVAQTTEVDHQEVVFYSEDQIADSIGANKCVNPSPCGDDCCTCDRECK